MDILFILLLVILSVVLLLAANPSDKAWRKKRTATARHAIGPITSPQKKPKCERPKTPPSPTPQRFDAESAKNLQDKRIISGAVYVTDGDTIKIKNTQIRLFGIDAPELNHPYGEIAKWSLYKLCKGEIVKAEIVEEDAYGRTVAKCFLADGRDLSAEMVKQGLAIDWPKYSGGTYRRFEVSDARKKLFLADARQKGRMHVWENFESRRN